MRPNCRRPIGRLWLLLTIILPLSVLGQNARLHAYLIVFKDKPLENSSPALAQKALDRRAKYRIGLDSLDYPVHGEYITAVCADPEIQLRYSLRWKNGIVVQSSRTSLDSLLALPFVKAVFKAGRTQAHQRQAVTSTDLFQFVKNTQVQTRNLTREDYGQSFQQLNQIRLLPLHKKGMDGSGIAIGVFDAGFHNAEVLTAFQRLRGNRKLHSVFDVVDLDGDVQSKDHHGTAVLSCMASFAPQEYVGSAPNADFYLFRTEYGPREDPLEELNWSKAAEMADSMGLDLVTSSVGYTTFDDPAYGHGYDELDGRTTFIAQAARTLYAKGVMVLTSAGNERDDLFQKVGTPADVAEIITVGAVDAQGRIGRFSSAGYNAAGVIKPDVCAMGVKAYVVSTYGTYYTSNGTSFSTPILAGAVACLMQANPTATPLEIANALRFTANRNHQPDSLYGYGLANLQAADQFLKQSELVHPMLLEQQDRMLVYNGEYDQIHYELYRKERCFLFFSRKIVVQEGDFQRHLPFSYLPIETKGLDCSEKYTLKLIFSNSVNNYELRHNDLSWCDT